MKLLLHMCCAPCTTYSQTFWGQLGYQLQGYFYNPNIHPYREFAQRLKTLQEYCAMIDIPLITDDRYDLEDFLQKALAEDNRCLACYKIRMDETAKRAAAEKIPYFSTTLAISPYQNHQWLREEGEAAGQRHHVTFVYEDLRPGYKTSIEESKRLELYRQPYCGCIFSEKERFHPKKK